MPLMPGIALVVGLTIAALIVRTALAKS